MFRIALVCLLALPIVELWLMFQLADAIGFLPAVALVIGTGAAGLLLAKRQGMQALSDVRLQMNKGKLPATSMADGALLLVAALLLIVPGVLTDIAGGLLLVPLVRKLVVFWALGKFRYGRTVQIVHGLWRRRSDAPTTTRTETPAEIVERSMQQNS